MDDYDYDDLDLDDGWLYVEDEFDLADELAEGQIAEPGYSGTNFDIAMDSYEFELFAYWDDLEYADDAYWDYSLAGKEDTLKRKRGTGGKKNLVDKRRRKEITYNREDDPLLLVSREQRMRSFFKPAPLLEDTVKYTFLADWKERFANADGLVESKDMPVSMKRAAEAETVEAEEEMGDTEEAWEDEDEDDDADENGQDDEEGEEGDDDEGGPGLDPDMLKEILKQKLGDAGLAGEDEAAFMQVIAKMMSGDEDTDELTGNLANSLLGKLTSDSGRDSALSGWLSQQGVSLQDGEDDDASSVATLDLPEGVRHTGLNTRQNAQYSPIDSVVGEKRISKQTPLHSGSPDSSSTKKRVAPTIAEKDQPSKKQKKVAFDVPSSSSVEEASTHIASPDGAAELPTSEDPLMSENTLPQHSTRSRKRDNVETDGASCKPSARTTATRKRKAAEDIVDGKLPEKKKTIKKEVDMLENVAAGSPMGPPARRTRAAKARGSNK